MGNFFKDPLAEDRLETNVLSQKPFLKAISSKVIFLSFFSLL